MKRNYFKKIISSILILGILLPLVISFSHVLQHHEHNICKAKTEKHIHSKKNNCSSFHYFIDIQYKVALKNIEIDKVDYFNALSAQLNFLFYFTCIFSILERGHPSVNVF